LYYSLPLVGRVREGEMSMIIIVSPPPILPHLRGREYTLIVLYNLKKYIKE